MKTLEEREKELQQKLASDMGIWELKALVRKYLNMSEVAPVQLDETLLIQTILKHEYLQN